MTKHLRFLFVMLLAMIWSAGWAAETVYKTLSFPDEKKENCNSYTTILQHGMLLLVTIVGK